MIRTQHSAALLCVTLLLTRVVQQTIKMTSPLMLDKSDQICDQPVFPSYAVTFTIMSSCVTVFFNAEHAIEYAQ